MLRPLAYRQNAVAGTVNKKKDDNGFLTPFSCSLMTVRANFVLGFVYMLRRSFQGT